MPLSNNMVASVLIDDQIPPKRDGVGGTVRCTRDLRNTTAPACTYVEYLVEYIALDKGNLMF